MGTKTALKIESFAFFDNSRFMTTELCKARITVLALPIRVSSSSSCLRSLVNATPRYLNFSPVPALVSRDSLATRTDQGFLKDEVYLSFCRAYFHSGGVTCICKANLKCWRPDSVNESRTKSPVNSKRLILQFPIVAHSSAWLH